MSPQQVNQYTAAVAIVLIVILFILVVTGKLDSLTAIVITVVIGVGVRFVRSMLIH